MKSVILAAGRGTRLKEITYSKNKCALEINGKSIIRRIVDSFKSNGVNDIYIVVGHKKEDIIKEIKGDAEYLDNPLFSSEGILRSLWYAKESVFGEEFVLSTGDVLFNPKIFPEFLGTKGDVVVAVKKKKCCEEDVKVVVNNGKIHKMEENIPCEEAVGEFGMIIKFSSEPSKRLFEVVKNILEDGKKKHRLIDALNIMIRDGVEFTPYFFHKGVEVDTKEDLEESKSIVKEFDDESAN